MAMEYVKENVPARPPVPVWVVVCGLLATMVALVGVTTLVDHTLPPPLTRRDAPPDRFIAEIAYEHLVNITNIGPRVAGTYENEVAAVSVLVAAAKEIARAASPHNVVDIDLQRASGGFSLSFFDGMNNIYSDVQNVVVRARSVGGRPTATKRTAILLNCHFDTVPDTPGASDDAAGCAVGLETLRALVAAPRPLRHDVILLLNGAEENIMQASHAFITQHKWAGSVRAFINMEACGAGGREVLFQAGPYDPWIVEVYAHAVPHPFASSVAQEMFQGGFIPSDTDFRIFRDFGKLSGLDLAWNADGYVYHTRLDAPDRVPPAAIQRTGDNVLALVNGMLSSAELESVSGVGAGAGVGGQPVFFDVVGVWVVVARGGAALAAAMLTCALVVLRLHISAAHAQQQLYMPRGAWMRAVCRAGMTQAVASGAGVAAGAGASVLLHACGVHLLYYSTPALLGPLYAAPALAAALEVLSRARTSPPLVRGWWAGRAHADALAAGAALLVAACALLRLRSGYVPLLWALLPTVADLAATTTRATDVGRAWWWAGGYMVPVLQTGYLCRDFLATLVPLAGRAGSSPVPIDVVMACVVSCMVLWVFSWLVPLMVASRHLRYIAWAAGLCGAAACAWAVWGAGEGGGYSPRAPQRLMTFHVRRDHHHHNNHTRTETYFWVPQLDDNTLHTLNKLGPGWVPSNTVEECERWMYCGAPYFLPVLGLVHHAHARPAPPHAHATLMLAHNATHVHGSLYRLTLHVTGPPHVVVIVSPGAGGVVEGMEGVEGGAVEGARWGERRTYFVSLYAARAHTQPRRTLHMTITLPVSDDPELCQISVSGHGMGGPLSVEQEALKQSLPDTVAHSGWPVHHHLYTINKPTATAT